MASLSPHTHPPLDLLGCIFCNSVTLLYKAHALPHSAGLTHTPENAHLGAPAGIRPSGASRPCLYPAGGVGHAGIRPSEAFPSLPVSRSLYPAGGVVHAGIPHLKAFPSVPVSRSLYPAGGVVHAGIRPSGASRPCLRPASSTRLGTSLGGLPHPPKTHPTLDLLGCIFCNSVTLLYKAHALPHSAGLKNTP